MNYSLKKVYVYYEQKGGLKCIMPIPPIRREDLNLSKNI